jgi:hypothetical protein
MGGCVIRVRKRDGRERLGVRWYRIGGRRNNPSHAHLKPMLAHLTLLPYLTLFTIYSTYCIMYGEL